MTLYIDGTNSLNNCFWSAVSYGLWNDHVLGWWKHKEVSNVLFLKYEDLKKVITYANIIVYFSELTLAF